jgi:hypothetical protein
VTGRPVVVGAFGALALAAAVLVALTWPPAFSTPEFPPNGRLLPEEAFFHRTITDLPVAADSERWVSSFAEEPLIAGFGGSVTNGIVFGIPFNPVDAGTPRQSVDIGIWGASSYQGEYPIADPAYIESMPSYGIDNHYIALDRDARTMWELGGTRVWFGRWQADAGVKWDLDDLKFPRGSTMAAGLPFLPGVLSWDEVDAGRVEHVILAGTPITAVDEFVWPARGTDGRSTDPDAPPMGSWLRLRADADLSALGPQARAIAEAMQQHGVVLSDTSANFALRGTPDARWDRSDLRTLRTLTGADFEVVDTSTVMVDAGSMEARPPNG